MSDIPYFKSKCFLFDKLTFSEGKLEIFIGDESNAEGKILFNFVRSFAFFKETDFWQGQEKYELRKIIEIDGERTLGVFQILKNSILQNVIPGKFDEEEPLYYWLSTPDECLEVICFEVPVIFPSGPPLN